MKCSWSTGLGSELVFNSPSLWLHSVDARCCNLTCSAVNNKLHFHKCRIHWLWAVFFNTSRSSFTVRLGLVPLSLNPVWSSLKQEKKKKEFEVSLGPAWKIASPHSLEKTIAEGWGTGGMTLLRGGMTIAASDDLPNSLNTHTSPQSAHSLQRGLAGAIRSQKELALPCVFKAVFDGAGVRSLGHDPWICTHTNARGHQMQWKCNVARIRCCLFSQEENKPQRKSCSFSSLMSPGDQKKLKEQLSLIMVVLHH